MPLEWILSLQLLQKTSPHCLHSTIAKSLLHSTHTLEFGLNSEYVCLDRWPRACVSS